MNSSVSRIARMGVFPVAGRPLFFLFDICILRVLHKSKPRRSVPVRFAGRLWLLTAAYPRCNGFGSLGEADLPGILVIMYTLPEIGPALLDRSPTGPVGTPVPVEAFELIRLSI